MNPEQHPTKFGEPVRPAPAPSLCPLACTVTSATRHLLQGSERLRPRDERDAFDGLVILALEFQHGGRTSDPAAEHLSARPSARARKNVTVRCTQFVQRAKSVRSVTAAHERSADKVSKILEEDGRSIQFWQIEPVSTITERTADSQAGAHRHS